MNQTDELLMGQLGIDPKVLGAVRKAEQALSGHFQGLSEVAE